MDDVLPVELALLPLEAWVKRRLVMQLYYEQRVLPDSYYDVSSPALGKGAKLQAHTIAEAEQRRQPANHRLLGIFTALYRVEGGAIFRQHLPWLLTWIHPELHGCIPGRDLGDVAWDAQAHIEEALLQNRELVVYMLDYVKIFDMSHPDWVRGFLKHLGMDTRLVDVLHNLYTNLRRRIKLGRHFGPIFTTHNGLAAGDSMALLVALAFVSCQFSYIQRHVPNVALGACVDDRNIRGSFDDVTHAYRLTMRFDSCAGHFNNHKKLNVITTTPSAKKRLRKINYGTEDKPLRPNILKRAPLVGETINAGRSPDCRNPHLRTLHALTAATRATHAPTNPQNKALALAAVAIPRMLTGCSWTFPSTNSLSRLRTTILSSVWSNVRALRATEAVITILCNPKRVDPWGALVFKTIMYTRRTCTRNPQRLGHLQHVYALLNGVIGQSRVQGPAHTFFRVAALLNVTFEYVASRHSFRLRDENGLAFDLIHDQSSYIKTVLDKWIRTAFTRELSRRTLSRLTREEATQHLLDNPKYKGFRKDFHGLPPRIDLHATTDNFNKYKDDAHGLNILKSFVAGSVRARDRLHAAGILTDDKCTHPGCCGARHTTHHMLWDCKRHSTVRDKYKQRIDDLLQKANKSHGNFARAHLETILNSNSFRHTSVCPDDPCAYRRMPTRHSEDVPQLIPDSKRIYTDNTEGLNYDCVQSGDGDDYYYVRAFSDGSVLRLTSIAHAAAGWAVYFGPGHRLNYRSTLYSPHQSSFRAEARAILHILLHSGTYTAIYSDCKGAVN